MNNFYVIIYCVLLLLISACFSKQNGTIKHVPSYSRVNQNIVSNKVIFPILSPNDKTISKYYSFLNQKKNSGSQLVELGVELVSICDGIAANISPSVLDFLTCPVAKILLQPDRVESYKVKPKPNMNIPEQERLGPFPIEMNGQGRNLEGENLKKFQALLLTENSYVFGKEKRCRFRPEMGLHFIKGNEAVEVLFSVPCRLWLFVYRDVKKLEDFDRILDKMAFMNSLFIQAPVDE